MVWSFLIHFKGLPVRVVKEYETLACCRIGPDILVSDTHSVKFSDLTNDVIDLKGQVTESCRLRV